MDESFIQIVLHRKLSKYATFLYVYYIFNYIASSPEDISNSHISPRSQTYEPIFEDIQSSQSVNFDLNKNSNTIKFDGDDKIRIERSAMPVLKEIWAHNLGSENSIDLVEHNDVESFGRYINSIHPTKSESILNTNSQRTGKNIANDNSFLLKRGLPVEVRLVI